MKAFALIETKKGYRLTLVDIANTNFGGFRKYRDTSDLFYKKRDFAYNKALSFFTSIYRDVKFFGVIDNGAFTGETASESEYNLFNRWLTDSDKREFKHYASLYQSL
jgi:hypothetical protein